MGGAIQRDPGRSAVGRHQSEHRLQDQRQAVGRRRLLGAVFELRAQHSDQPVSAGHERGCAGAVQGARLGLRLQFRRAMAAAAGHAGRIHLPLEDRPPTAGRLQFPPSRSGARRRAPERTGEGGHRRAGDVGRQRDARADAELDDRVRCAMDAVERVQGVGVAGPTAAFFNESYMDSWFTSLGAIYKPGGTGATGPSAAASAGTSRRCRMPSATQRFRTRTATWSGWGSAMPGAP